MANLFEIVNGIDLALSLGSLAILVYLLVIYVKLYLELRQRFTLGFIIFNLILIMHNISGTFFHFFHFGFIGGGPRDNDTNGTPPPHMPAAPRLGADNSAFLFLRVIPSALEFVALLVLLWLSRE